MAFVVVRHRAAAALLHREARLGTVQGLDLAFLIHAEDERVLGWIQVQAHNILDLLLEARVATELKGPDQMGLEAVRVPHALHQSRVGPQMPGQRPCGPVRRGGRTALGRGVKNLRLQGLPTPGRTSAPRGVVLNPCQPVPGEPLSPQAHGLPTGAHGGGDVPVLVALSGQQDDLRAQHQTGRSAPPPGPVA